MRVQQVATGIQQIAVNASDQATAAEESDQSVRQMKQLVANVSGGAAMLRWRHEHLEDFTAALPGMTLPCLLYCGEDDEEYEGMRRASTVLSNARFIGLPGMNHVQVSGASAQLVPELVAFWNYVGA